MHRLVSITSLCTMQYREFCVNSGNKWWKSFAILNWSISAETMLPENHTQDCIQRLLKVLMFLDQCLYPVQWVLWEGGREEKWLVGALILKIYKQQRNTHMICMYAWFLTEPSSLKHKYSFHQLLQTNCLLNDKVCIATYSLKQRPTYV